MKAFRFSLQSLRVLREQKERLAQKRYAEALRASEAVAARLGAANRERATAWRAMGEEMRAGAAIARLQQVRAWCREWEQRCDHLTAAAKKTDQAAGKARQEMLLATRDRKVLDNLHDQRRRAYDYAVHREEQNRLDEVGLRSSGALSGRPETAFKPKEQA